jgi:hypothetical protein
MNAPYYFLFSFLIGQSGQMNVRQNQKTKMDRGEPQRITVVTETRNLRTLPFVQNEDLLSTGKQWEEWIEEIEREFRYFRIFLSV